MKLNHFSPEDLCYEITRVDIIGSFKNLEECKEVFE
jgi:hypothetical protein